MTVYRVKISEVMRSDTTNLNCAINYYKKDGCGGIVFDVQEERFTDFYLCLRHIMWIVKFSSTETAKTIMTALVPNLTNQQEVYKLLGNILPRDLHTLNEAISQIEDGNSAFFDFVFAFGNRELNGCYNVFTLALGEVKKKLDKLIVNEDNRPIWH